MEHGPQNDNAKKVPPQVFKLHSSQTIYNNCMLKTKNKQVQFK